MVDKVEVEENGCNNDDNEDEEDDDDGDDEGEDDDEEEADRFQRALVFRKRSSQALTWACGVCLSFSPSHSLPLFLSLSLFLSPSVSAVSSVSTI